MKFSFHDDGNARDGKKFHFFSEVLLGEKQSYTPEGFLICEEVPIARTGSQIYDASELPFSSVPGPVSVMREEAEVFKPEYIASFEGKPLVNDHPGEDVTPANWREFAHGHIQNVRRGTGKLIDYLLADFVVCSPEGIKEIRDNGKREVSCGYDAEYEELAPGRARQYDMVGNHVALVTKARCGERCAIGDGQLTGDADMHMKARDEKRTHWLTKLRDAWKNKDEAAAEEAMKEAEKEGAGDKARDELHLHIGGSNGGSTTGMETTSHDGRRMSDEDIEGRFKKIEDGMAEGFKKIEDAMRGAGRDSEAEKAIEGELKEEAPPGTGDAMFKGRDSAFLGETVSETLSLAALMVPDIQAPTFDANASPATTLRAIKTLRSKALELYNMTPEGRQDIEGVLRRPLTTDSMPADQLRMVFRAVAAQARLRNNTASFGDRGGRQEQRDNRGTRDEPRNGLRLTPAEMNARNAKYYGTAA